MTVYGADCGREDKDVTTNSPLQVQCFVDNIEFPDKDEPILDKDGNIVWECNPAILTSKCTYFGNRDQTIGMQNAATIILEATYQKSPN